MEKTANAELFATKKGIVTVKNPVRIQILEALKKSECQFDDLVVSVHKAKSTVSVHLGKMQREGLIVSVIDKKDRRKKIYRCTATYVGTTSAGKYELTARIKNDICGNVGDPFNFMRSLFRTMRYITEAMGINAKPALKLTGREIGRELAKLMKSTVPEELLNELANFWETHRMGHITIIRAQLPFEIVIENCYECGGMPDVGSTLCSLDEGLISAILDEKLGVKSVVKELECCGSGHPHCRFTVDW